jgi:radical SAM protein with 4Fe4S-binding SPASM domain
LKNWLLELDKMKICGRINPCYGAPEYELDEKRMKEVYLDLADFCLHHNLRWSPFTDIIDGLQGKPRVCTYMGCDIFSTPSATVLLGDGSLTNCMRTNQEGILLRHPVFYNTRDQILSQTPQIYGGCQGCSYWSACHGGCPMSAINNDWRNRSFLCPTHKALFQFYEKILSFCGFSTNLCQTQGQPPKEGLVEIKPGWFHGDHDDAAGAGGLHGDAPHGDSHGDHEDSSLGFQTGKERTEIKPGFEHGDSPHGDWSDHKDSG